MSIITGSAKIDEETPGRQGIPHAVWRMSFAELWERFSYYGLQGILSFYLLYSLTEGGLQLDPSSASGIVGAYGGSVYVAQLVGAWMGDRLVAPKLMVLYGGIVITLGHVVLAVTGGLVGLLAGLALIIIGTGALKTNITAIVGYILDGTDSAKRDAGFSYFLMAINIGAVIGPLSTGFAQSEYGFHYGFGLAAVGMVVALVQYGFSMSRLPAVASRVNNPLTRAGAVKAGASAVIAVAAVAVVAASGLIPVAALAAIVTGVAVLAAVWYFSLILLSPRVTRDEKVRVGSYIPLFVTAGIYFGLLFQQFTSIAIMITKRVDLLVGGWTFPVAWITTSSQLAAVLVTPFVARWWEKQGDRQPGPATKFGFGMLQMGLAYAALAVVAAFFPAATIPLAIIIVVMAVAGSSEILVNPIGMALVSKIGPAAFRSQLVGLSFLTLALGSSLSGLLGQLFAGVSEMTYFVVVTGLSLVVGLILLVARKRLERGLTAGLI